MAQPSNRSSIKQHPRRVQAHKSVSLRRTTPPDQLSDAQHAPASDRANPPSTQSSQLLAKKNSSGESSDAGKWFDSSNNNVMQDNSALDADEPPFFLRNSSSSETPPDQMNLQPHQQLQYRHGFIGGNDGGSSTEDFRSVIDDLTIQNKKLKKKLKKYEKYHDAHLQDEKLFEIRFHGLPAHKKRELEATLRTFTLSLEDAPSDATSPAQLYAQNAPSALEPQNTVASSKSADSAYASASASGVHSLAPSGQGSNNNSKPVRPVMDRQQQSASIQSYLHDIPLGLLPRTNLHAMTEKSKKRLVVQRLEQIFAGKTTTTEGHQQPMQQQEVAQSAAQDDRRAIEASGKLAGAEGRRQAHIMFPGSSEDCVDVSTDYDSVETSQRHGVANIVQQDFAPTGTFPDQRPTRPLDLDPHRAQVPADNFQYIRHLGFSPPNVATMEAHEGGHGWIYLNLLINMAQLHTLNVTPEFVQKALESYSSRFEISTDGRKVRWKGGRDATYNKSDTSSEDQSSGISPEIAEARKVAAKKRSKISSVDASETPDSRQSRAKDKFAYVPLFFRKDSTDSMDSFADNVSDSSNMQVRAAGSSAFASSGMQTTSSKRKRRDAGPVIFYNKAKFCTDLSGDPNYGHSGEENTADYQVYSSMPVGIIRENTIASVGDSDSGRKPLSSVSPPAEPMYIDSSPASSSVGLRFASDVSPMDSSAESSPMPVVFEASGLGGVVPGDNFSIDVQTQKKRLSSKPTATRMSHHYPNRLIQHDEHAAPALAEEVIATSRKDLAPSSLPPPSFLRNEDSGNATDDDVDMDYDDYDSDDASSIGAPTTQPQMLTFSPNPGDSDASSDGSDEEEDDDDDDSDSGSVDFLATARTLDPENVRKKEREYDANIAERLAEEIPAGSSAATAGGGSGFNSPADARKMEQAAMDLNKRLSADLASTPVTAGLKRARTSDDLTAQSSKTPRAKH